MADKLKILIVDDEAETANLIARYFKRKGHEAVSLDNPLVGLEALEKDKFDIIISDINMPQMSGIEFVKKAKEISSDLIVILLTGYGSLGTAREAIKIGVDDYLLKPVQLEELLKSIDKALGKKKDPEYYLILKKDLDKTKDELLTLISHELRTPVSIISESFDLLKDSPSDDKIKELNDKQRNSLFKNIESAQHRLNSIIEDLTYYISFGKEEVTLNKNRVVLNDFLESNFKVFKELVSKSKSVLKKNFSKSNQVADIDSEKILDLLSRLIHNAIFHNPDGVEVVISLSSSGRIEVFDNGKGIDDKILDSIFEPFKVGDIDHHSKGIGISLAICKKIVNIHSGDIKIESKIGKGTKVTIDLAKIEGGAK